MKKFKYIVFVFLIVAALLTIRASDSQASTRPIMEDLWFTAVNFPDSTGHDYIISEEGVTVAGEAITAVFDTLPIKAPIPFNAVVPQWTAVLPAGSDIDLLIRTSENGREWSDWVIMESHPDMTEINSPTFIGDIIGVPEADKTHEFLQFSIGLHREDLSVLPILQTLRFTFINSTNGLSQEEMISRQIAFDQQPENMTSETDYPKPFVISRNVWCTDPACNYSNGLDYHPVTHLIVHHTVSNNNTVDWAAHLRAIWSYHTFTLGWGDVGYNYLVDPYGNLYEGHLGGDNVVGTHASAANHGTMALSFLGTFETVTPSNAMLDAAADLFAWKADQRNIDVYGASDNLPNIPWGLPHIMGHRDVYGGTQTACPGSTCHTLLPWLRDEVASRIGQESIDFYVDELSGNFIKSNTNWHVPDGQCGFNTHAYYTWSTTSSGQSSNWGEWYPDLVVNGRYRIEAHIPYCDTGEPETSGARYQIHHATGTTNVTINQNNNAGLWVNLGEFDLLGDGSSYVRLTDLTSTDNGRGVWFDAIRVRPIDLTGVTATNQTPADQSWTNQLNIDFNWHIENADDVQQTRLQVATDADFDEIIYDQNWATAQTTHSHTFGQAYQELYWRIILMTQNGESISDSTQFGFDVGKPVSSVDVIHYNTLLNEYTLFWHGQDGRSGIASYNIEMRQDGTNDWQPFLSNTAQKTAVFAPPSNDIYWFRSQAIDNVGNTENFPSGDGDISTAEAITVFNPKVAGQSPNSWGTHFDITFNWVYTDITDIQTAVLNVATDPDFNNIILAQDVTLNGTTYQHNFAQETDTLYWHIAVTFIPPDGTTPHTLSSETNAFGIDTTAPESSISQIYQQDDRFYLVLSTNEGGAGIATYNIEYRPDGGPEWIPLIETTEPFVSFISPNIFRTYYFRLYATDSAGNVELAHNSNNASTDQAIPFAHAIMLPFVTKN